MHTNIIDTIKTYKNREQKALSQIRKADSKLHVLNLALKQKTEPVDLEDILSCLEAVQADILITESLLIRKNAESILDLTPDSL
ncbi:MAG: hypothetical protein ACR2PT_07415 [Endozoicomonas sp.]